NDFSFGLANVTRADARLRELIDIAGRPTLRRRPAGFARLCAVVCSQQLSTASAAAIWGRLAATFDPLDAEALRRARARTRRRIGVLRLLCRERHAPTHV